MASRPRESQADNNLNEEDKQIGSMRAVVEAIDKIPPTKKMAPLPTEVKVPLITKKMAPLPTLPTEIKVPLIKLIKTESGESAIMVTEELKQAVKMFNDHQAAGKPNP